jgi:hypothetical protein
MRNLFLNQKLVLVCLHLIFLHKILRHKTTLRLSLSLNSTILTLIPRAVIPNKKSLQLTLTGFIKRKSLS